jgi:hypothetical protein
MNMKRGEKRLYGRMNCGQNDTNDTPIWFDNNGCSIKSFHQAVSVMKRKSQNHTVNCATRSRLKALVKCSELFTTFHVPVKVFETYKSTYLMELKENDCKNIPNLLYKCAVMRDILCNHVPVIVLYACEGTQIVPYFVKKVEGIDWTAIASLQWPGNLSLAQDKKRNDLQEIATYGLKACSSEKDRAILKCILTKVLSVEELRKMKLISSGRVRKLAETQCLKGMINGTSPEPRALGAGRPALEQQYEELVGLFIQLFDGTGEGLRSHPRLITDVLYLEHNTWMNMPRCVSMLRNMYGIDISVSAAYTFTENARVGSQQSKRHKKISVPISIKRSTRDLVKNPSINSHYASANMQYLYRWSFTNEAEVAVVARDNKARVHCDVEVVDRPSKSWRQIRYSDHHFEKDSKRSITITTYQFVKENSFSPSSNILTTIGDLPVTRTRVTGRGLCVVKSAYFQDESVFRHLNELLIVMVNNKDHFMHDGKLKPNLVVTVDGGGDERPRNKATKFCCTLLRWLLNRDRVIQISYAEHDSKLHSVERVHAAENYALSQHGEVSSNQMFAVETDKQGHVDMSKMKQNMFAAVRDVVNRLQGTPFATSPITAFESPDTSDWVFAPECEQQIRDFLRVDSVQHRQNYNFVLKPAGPTWMKMKEVFRLGDGITNIHAKDIHDHMTDERFIWCQHYGITIYRKDENWVGTSTCRFEIQPVPDISRLPEFHYLKMDKVKEVIQEYSATTSRNPDWLKPDFYLPSLNIENEINEKNSLSDENILSLSHVVFVPVEDIKKYLEERTRKVCEREENKKTKKRYKDTVLGQFNRDELIKILKHSKVKLLSRYYRKGELLTMVDGLVSDDPETWLDDIRSNVLRKK